MMSATDKHRVKHVQLAPSLQYGELTQGNQYQDSMKHDAATTSFERMICQLKQAQRENSQLLQEISNYRQKINALEEEKFTSASTFNKENCTLQSTVTKLQSQVEKGEAKKQSLEFDLAVAKKKAQDVIRDTTHKEVTLSKEMIHLSDEKSQLELKVAEMENELELTRKVNAENERKIAMLEDTKQQLRSETVASEAIQRSEVDKLTAQLDDRKYQLERVERQLGEHKQCVVQQEEDLRKTATDLQLAVEREKSTRQDYEVLLQRAHALEESVEAERAAHLESKFNSEIIQLKQQEFQSQLANERASYELLCEEAEDSKRKVEEYQKVLDFERNKTKSVAEKLELANQSHDALRKSLEADLSSKTRVVDDLTNQLDRYEDELAHLKDELARAKKKLITLDESYSGNIREVELLLETYCHPGDVDLPAAATKSKSKSGGGKKEEESPKIVLERLRQTMFAYQKKIEQLKRDTGNRQIEMQQTQKDCDNFRDMAIAREKALEQAQVELRSCTEELERIRTQQQEYARESDRTRRDLEEMTVQLQLQVDKCRQLEDSIDALQNRHGDEVDIHVGYLREIYHVVCSATGEANTVSKFTWLELSLTLRSAVDALVALLRRAQDQVAQLTSSRDETQRSMSDLQRAHESSVDRLAARCRERDEEAVRQRKQLEQHYEALLSEMNLRTQPAANCPYTPPSAFRRVRLAPRRFVITASSSLSGCAQKTQAMCDEAWARVRTTDHVHDGLHAECAELRGENGQLVQERKSLAAACAILFGALYPALRARDELAQQRHLLARMNSDGETCKVQMRSLVDTLNCELAPKSGDKQQHVAMPTTFRSIHPLIRFRVAVVAVLAANRLRRFASLCNCPMFVCNESAISNNRIVVVAGKIAHNSPRSGGDATPVTSRSDVAVEWLSSTNMVHGVRDATCGVVDAVAKNAGDTSGYLSRAVVKTAKNAFLNLMEATHPQFTSYTAHARNILRERNTLCRMLAEGLERVIHLFNLRQTVSVFSVEHSFSALQRHLLTFTERLHAAEVEKRDMRGSEVKLRQQIERSKHKMAELESNTRTLRKIKDNERHLVSKERFEGVCTELNSALERERKAQELLREQNSQLQDLSSKLEHECNDGVHKELTLNEAVTSLTEVKMELKRTGQSKRQLERQVDRLQLEKDRLEQLVNEAKDALKRAAGEKTSIANYFATVEKTLQQGADDDDLISDKLKLHSEELTSKAGPGLQAAQRAVETFVRAQSSAVSRISNLETQISSYRDHIGALKRELHDACHRDQPSRVDFRHRRDDLDLMRVDSTPTRDDDSLDGGVTTARRRRHLDDRSSLSFQPLVGEIVTRPSFGDLSDMSRRSQRRYVDDVVVTSQSSC